MFAQWLKKLFRKPEPAPPPPPQESRRYTNIMDLINEMDEAFIKSPSGRAASRAPNLQDIPRRTVEGARIRRAFVSAPSPTSAPQTYDPITSSYLLQPSVYPYPGTRTEDSSVSSSSAVNAECRAPAPSPEPDRSPCYDSSSSSSSPSYDNSSPSSIDPSSW